MPPPGRGVRGWLARALVQARLTVYVWYGACRRCAMSVRLWATLRQVSVDRQLDIATVVSGRLQPPPHAHCRRLLFAHAVFLLHSAHTHIQEQLTHVKTQKQCFRYRKKPLLHARNLGSCYILASRQLTGRISVYPAAVAWFPETRFQSYSIRFQVGAILHAAVLILESSVYTTLSTIQQLQRLQYH